MTAKWCGLVQGGGPQVQPRQASGRVRDEGGVAVCAGEWGSCSARSLDMGERVGLRHGGNVCVRFAGGWCGMHVGL